MKRRKKGELTRLRPRDCEKEVVLGGNEAEGRRRGKEGKGEWI